jgi:PAT family beta-lactamase induction signal transducer AmpG
MSRSTIKTILSLKMLAMFTLGFSSGFPFYVIREVLKAWLTDANIDLGTIGLFSAVALPYTWKFIWSPAMDGYTPPFLGRRRGWMLLTQVGLLILIACLGQFDPVKSLKMMAVTALGIAFFSASQDIVVDAYRREDLSDRELGLGSSLYINGYRVGMLLASGGGLIMADHIPFSMVYLIMALCLLPGVVTTLLTPEPSVASLPRTLRSAVVDPLVEYFSRPDALWILAFILMYKIGDTMAAAMTTPFYLDIGFSKSQIGAVVKLFGFWATVGGTIVGGIAMLRLGIMRSLWLFGLLQALSTAGFALLAVIGADVKALSAVIAFENLSGGMGTSAYAAYMASITDKRFTATQYALLTSLMGIPRVLASAPTGYLATQMGWPGFFVLCTLIAVPGLALLLRIHRSDRP